MDISTSTSLPLGLAKSPAGLGISGSGSFQSHLSTGESHSRLRAGIHPSPGKELLQYNVHHKSNSADMSNTPGSNRLAAGMSNRLSAEIGLENHASSRLLLSWPRTWLQWVFVVYCCLSVIFFTTAMFNYPERFHHLLSSPGEQYSLKASLLTMATGDHCRHLHPLASRIYDQSTTSVYYIIYSSTADRFRAIPSERKCTLKRHIRLLMVSRQGSGCFPRMGFSVGRCVPWTLSLMCTLDHLLVLQ